MAALPRVLLFDLDDTILRFSAGQPNFWRSALLRHLPEHEDHLALFAAIDGASQEFWAEAERAFWGRQNMQAARRLIAYTALGPHGVVQCECHRIADHMTESKEGYVRPFDGAPEALRVLRERGHRLGLLTNGSSAFQRRKLSRYELEPLFEILLIEGELGYGKPDRRVFEAALQHFGRDPRETWMIGDNLEADVAGAQALGIFGVWHDAEGTGLPAASPIVPDKVLARVSDLLAL